MGSEVDSNWDTVLVAQLLELQQADRVARRAGDGEHDDRIDLLGANGLLQVDPPRPVLAAERRHTSVAEYRANIPALHVAEGTTRLLLPGRGRLVAVPVDRHPHVDRCRCHDGSLIGRSVRPLQGIFRIGVPKVKTAEAMKRYREGEHGDPVFERLLGVDMKREQYRKGRAFCEVVVEQTDEATLARIWESADAMPSLPELDEPRLWLARTV